ncbi:hypothetical protein HUU61_22180 [Rhodopseudomonas palustris]|nr:hypothetical protein [Rhodopseudomonas palustris]
MRFSRALTIGATIIFVGSIAVVLLAVALLMWGPDDITDEDKKFTSRILQTRDAVVMFRDVHPDLWDYVCYIEPYALTSETLRSRLPLAGVKLNFSPYDRGVGEERWGVAFVTLHTSQARVYLIAKREVNRIEGPACLARETASFKVETIVANIAYTQLTMAADHPR